MPLPWKKAKVSRISRIVANLHPPKSTNSLVMETGFPTSLVDLFVKNRDRLRKPIKNKKKKKQQQNQCVDNDLVISDPIPSSSSTDFQPSEHVSTDNTQFEWPENFSNHSKTTAVDRNGEGLMGKDLNCDSNEEIKRSGGGAVGGGVVDSNDYVSNRKDKPLLITILKIFFVVVLALSTKRLVLGVTISTFVLIFLEFIGKKLFHCFLKSCGCVKLAFQGLSQRVFFLFRMMKMKKLALQEKEGSIDGKEQHHDDDDNVGDSSKFDHNLEWKNLIKAAETSSVDSNGRDKSVTILDLLNSDMKWGVELVEEDDGKVSISGKEHSQISKFKRKMIKKMVPKKLRAIRKGRRKEKEREADSSSEVSSYWGDAEDKILRVE